MVKYYKFANNINFKNWLISFLKKNFPSFITGVAVGGLSVANLMNMLPNHVQQQVVTEYENQIQQSTEPPSPVAQEVNIEKETPITEKNQEQQKLEPKTENINKKYDFLGNKKYTRGLRNNNPGNIEKGTDWQGLNKEQLDSRFATFESPEMGIRAIAVILKNYQKKYQINTIEGIINRWAPSKENDTKSYINEVSKNSGINPKQKIDLNDNNVLLPIIKAIIKHENGSNPYSDGTILTGIKKASNNSNWLVKLAEKL
jgi:hypothetical protein